MLAQRLKVALSDPYRVTKGIVFVALVYLIFGAILPGILSTWEETHTAGSLDVTPAMRAQLVEALANKVTLRYIDAQKAMHVAAALRKAERDGEFDGITSPGQIARMLGTEIARSSGDQHMRVIFSPAEVPDFGDRNFPPQDTDDHPIYAWLMNHVGRYLAPFGVDDVSQSDAGIGYLRLGGFMPPYLSAGKFAGAMDSLADAKALIIDLRDNSGGSRDGVALLASYFFDRPTHLSDVVAPRSGERLQTWTHKGVQGSRYGASRPIFILTSHATFSGGEDFAYAMQTHKRATIIGEVTRGGAHPTAPFRLSPHFIAAIPVAETISPITRTNWEGVGVQPDIVVPARYARKVATTAILKQQLATETDAARRARMQAWLRAEQY